MAWDDTKATGDDITASEWNAQVTAQKSIASITDMDEQSFTNLLDNGDFESWSAGAAAVPDTWDQTGAGGTIAREGTIVKLKTYSVKLTRNGTDTYHRQTISDYADYAGRVITYGVWVYATVANRARIQIMDGVGQTNSSYHTGNSTWQWMTLTHTVDASPNFIRILNAVKTGDTDVYFDGAILVEGSVCPAFSPKPAPATNPTFIGNIKKSATNGITAFATGGQASAVELTTDINEVSVCATGGDSTKLPAGIAGMEIMVVNHGAAAMDLFPASGDYINEAAVNTAVSIAINATAVCYCYVADYWEIVEVARA